MDEKFDVICLPPQNKPVYFIIKALHSGDEETRSYRYEEGDCPANLFLNGVEEIITDGDDDPHGLFEFVREVELGDKRDLRALVPEAFDETVVT